MNGKSSATALTEDSRETLRDPADLVMERTIWRKLDLYILPVVSMFYFLSFLDRSNIGNARVAGLQKDLKMTNDQYSIALTITYVPYIVAELPSNLLLKAVGPDLMLPTMLTLWGIVTALQGIVTTYSGLLVCRFFLGLLEGGVFPGLVLYLSFFYPRQRLNWRITLFFSAASLSGAFSGLLAFGIMKMNGIGHKAGWEWIFILEGVFTLLFGITSYLLLPRSPEHAGFLSNREKAYIATQLKQDGTTSKDEYADTFSWREVGKAFTLPHVWMLSIVFFFTGTTLYALAYFTPSIVQGLGYTAARAQLMTVPPFAVAFVLGVISAYISDRFHCRGLVSIFSSILSVIGFTMFLSSGKQSIQYASLFFSIPGSYIAAPTLSTWNANNTAPHTRRATAIAIGFIMTNSGGILATWLLGSLSPAPRYFLGTRVLLSFSVLMAVVSAFNILYLSLENNRKAEIRQASSQEQEKPGLGDKSAWFVYNL